MAIETLTTASSFDGYHFGCSCGEQYNSITAAYHCRKCRNYCVFGYCTHVVDLRTGEVVAGEEPSQEEYAAKVAEMEPIWAEERRQLQLEMQMWRQEGELYEAEMQRQREEAARRQAEEEEDILWDVQERLSR